MTTTDFQTQTAAVIGLARAGIPAARFLLERGARVLCYDAKPRENLSADALELETLGAQIHAGDHDFQNIESADLIVLSPGLKIHYEPLKSVIEAAEARGTEVIGELELASRFCPCPMIAVTGTKGKSTTVKLITEMLRACGIDARSAGNTGTPLIEMLPQLTANSWAVVEVSSFQLEKAPTFKPKIAVLLSLLEDHQDYHLSLEQYWETKLKIFANQSGDDVAIFNVDDPRVASLFYGREMFGLDSSAQEEKKELGWPWIRRDGQFLVFIGEPNKPFLNIENIQIPGAHNLSNISAALLAVSAAIGSIEIPNQYENLSIWDFQNQIADTIRNFQTLPHRLETIATKDGVLYVNDSQSTIPDATVAALQSFPAPVTLLVGGRAKIEGESYRGLMEKVAEVGAKIIFFGESATMLEAIALSCDVEKFRIHRKNTLEGALHLAKTNAAPGETVVLSPACASFDQFKSYEDRGQTFRELVQSL